MHHWPLAISSTASCYVHWLCSKLCRILCTWTEKLRHRWVSTAQVFKLCIQFRLMYLVEFLSWEFTWVVKYFESFLLLVEGFLPLRNVIFSYNFLLVPSNKECWILHVWWVFLWKKWQTKHAVRCSRKQHCKSQF